MVRSTAKPRFSPLKCRARRLALAALASSQAVGALGACALPAYEVTGTSSTGGTSSSSTGGTGASSTTSTDCNDTSTDPENCGECGNRCPGGSCLQGVCEIQVFNAAEAVGDTYGHIVVDLDNVYWTRTGAVLRLPTTAKPGDSVTKLCDEVYNADFLAADDTYVYFTSFVTSKVHRLKKPDGKPELLVSGETGPVGLAVLGTKIYWAQYIVTGTIRELDTAGGAAMEFAPPSFLPFYVATDDNEVYWTYRGSQDIGGVKKGGQPDPIDLATGQSAPSGLAVDKTDVYWLGFDGSLERVPKGGGSTVTIHPAQGEKSIFAGDVVVDGTHVYWPGPGLNTCAAGGSCECVEPCGKVWRSPKASAAPEVFAEGDWGNVLGMAIDDEYVYWTTGKDGRILRKAKE